jgi:TetR/AcrR family transcriptional repressor of nem operon
MIPLKGVHVPKSHPPYSPEFRAEAVRLVREGGRSPDELAKDLGCSGQVIRNWVRRADLDAGRRSDGLMSDVASAIMDAAERRMRIGGFNGFSFREIAADVGIKSSSVHYHFPTKENLAAAVTRRYTERVVEYIDQELAAGVDPVKVWTRAFRRTLYSDEHMCPCIVLGAASRDLPPEVTAEVQRFFKVCLDKLVAAGLSPDNAAKLLATITGAMVIANALDDMGEYDRATRELMREPDSVTA